MGVMNSMIVDAIIQRLTDNLQTPYLDTDDTKLGYVGVGKLQDNYNKYGVSILVRSRTESKEHKIDNESYLKNIPIGLIGSPNPTVFYRRRFTLEFNLFFLPQDDDPEKDGFWEAQQKADLVLARARHAISTMPIISAVDDFGESMYHKPIVFSEFIEEGGSKRGKVNYRGDMVVDFFTVYQPN